MLQNAYSAIAEHLNTNWSATEIVPESTNKDMKGASFIRPTYLPITAEQVELGDAGSNRFDCYLNIDIFVPANKGIGEAAGYADNVLTLFQRNTTLTKNGIVVHFGVPEPQAGREDGLGYYQLPVQCPWYVYY